MPENEVETGQETVEVIKEEQQSSASKVVRKPKAVKDESEQSTPAKVEAKKSTSIEGIMTAIKNMTVLELAELVKTLEAEFGVSAAAPVAAMATAAAPTEAAPQAEEKTEFNVMLKEIGANKINVIKVVREVTSLGLKESKDLVESAPKLVKEGINKDEAAVVKQKLEEAGATAEVT